MKLMPTLILLVAHTRAPTTVMAKRHGGGPVTSSSTNSRVPTSQEASYSCTFTSTWTAASHPIEYPVGLSHFSAPVLVSHGPSFSLFAPGALATVGIEMLAEQGITSILVDEITAASGTGDYVVGVDQFIPATPNQTFAVLKVTKNYPFISSATMIAPSPDWFSGFSAFDCRGKGHRRGKHGKVWKRSFVVITPPLDAGTQTGIVYDYNQPDTNPHVPIFEITKDNAPGSGLFLSPDRSTVLPVGRWECTLLNAEPHHH